MTRSLLAASLPASLLALLGLLAISSGPASAQRPVIGHRIDARLDPASANIEVEDQLALPAGQPHWDLVLHRGMSPRVTSGNAEIERLGSDGHLEHLRLSPTDSNPVAIAYRGVIRHDLDPVREGMGRSRQTSIGTIGPDGVFLDGSAGWFPRVPGSLQRFDLRVALPNRWQAVSQGRGPGTEPGWTSTWSEHQPQDDIYLIAAPFTLYRGDAQASGVETQVWLRRPDPDLAQRYLDATDRYIDLYSRLIGSYPYAKFALVENYWETGYGMPSFTLLGPRVIRLPFIIHTSYPHEVLHNWWGNGVYVDYAAGNWSEGLTAYLADHLMKELVGHGAEYRRDALKSYADYVRGSEDFPLRAFRGRHGSASQAIGYGKAAMVFHMLRRMLGDERFELSLQRFYQDNRFEAAGWTDVRRAFETACGRDLGDFFDAWINRTGAPQLALSNVRQEALEDGYRVSGHIAQTQADAPFPLLVPVLVQDTEGGLHVQEVELTGRGSDFSIATPAQAVRVAVDPAFDTFRTLMPGESPVSLSNLFGSPDGTIVLPSAADAKRLAAYRELAQAWVNGHGDWRVVLDSELDGLPEAGPVWLLGWDNRLAPAFAATARGFALDLPAGRLTLADTEHDRTDTSVVLTSEDADRPVAWLGASTPAAIPGLARKLPHYGKYSYLVFTGEAPQNIAKGQWPAGDSALLRWLVEDRPEALLWDRSALIGDQAETE